MTEKLIEEVIGEKLRLLGLKLATAESCTGGLIGHRITNAPGSSEYFLGGVTAYAYEAKVKLLGVNWDTLARHGAVSQETVLEMARGARAALGADIGVSVSGIAGPGGGMPEKPVGLTWIGLSADEYETARSFVFPGERSQVKEQAAEQALHLLHEYLMKILQDVARDQRGLPDPKGLEAIEVTLRFDPQGQSFPIQFVWRERVYPVTSSGRRWQIQDGNHALLHILVMTIEAQTYELVFDPLELRWYLNTSQTGLQKALST